MPQCQEDPDRNVGLTPPRGAATSLRAVLMPPLNALADGLDKLVAQHGDAVTAVDPKLQRQVLSARMNFPVVTAAPEDAPTASTGRLLGPDRVLVASVARMARPETAHAIRAADRLDARVLGAMREVLARLAAVAPCHIHSEVTCLTAMLGAPRRDAEGSARAALHLTLNGVNVFAGPALPGDAAGGLARHAALLAGEPAAAPLPWRQFRVGSETIPAPAARRATELHLALTAPETLLKLRDPDLPEAVRARLRVTLPEVSEIRAPHDVFPDLAPTPRRRRVGAPPARGGRRQIYRKGAIS